MARRTLLTLVALMALACAAAATALIGTALAAPATMPLGLSQVRAHQVVAPEPVAVAPSPTPTRAAVKHVAPKAHHASPRPVRATRAPRLRHRHAPALTPEQLMLRAVNRIPGYHAGEAVFAITPNLGSWGLAELHSGAVYISPTVPSRRMYDVVAHEWSHVLSVKAYGGDVDAALAAMNTYFGGSDLVGAERAADCMARLLGASWTHYTPCSDSHWRAGARRLLSRERL